jgi:hypothetical protein
MFKKILVLAAGAASAAAAYGLSKARIEFRRWGIDPAEASKPLPGDEIVPEADATDTRGIEIAAPPEQVWPWLVQMGYGRGGWYSYDQVDMSHPSADRVIPELQKLAVGDILPTHPGGGFEVRILEPEKALVLYADRELIDSQAKTKGEGLAAASPNVRATGMYLDTAMPGDFRASWAFVLEPRAGGRTRLIERFRGWMPNPAATSPNPETAKIGQAIASRALLFGLFVMVRRQMLGIRDRVEGRPTRAFPWAGQPWSRWARTAQPVTESAAVGEAAPA